MAHGRCFSSNRAEWKCYIIDALPISNITQIKATEFLLTQSNNARNINFHGESSFIWPDIGTFCPTSDVLVETFIGTIEQIAELLTREALQISYAVHPRRTSIFNIDFGSARFLLIN